MIHLENLGMEDFEDVFRIMEQSFPIDERRNREGQQKLLSEEKYKLLGVKKDGKLLAFFAVWDFSDFVFIEHFAVEECARNSGTGGRMLKTLLEQKPGKVVLEVELPEDSIKKRRIAFYERNGFFFNDNSYMQPAMGEDRQAIPLRIMSAPQKLSVEEFETVRAKLYQNVYHYKCK